MALYYDRVKETSTTTGTGNLSLGGAATAFRTFSSVYANGDGMYYTITDQAGPNWEVGFGHYVSAGNQMSRGSVLASSNGGAAVNFTSGALFVFVVVPAAQWAANGSGSYTGSGDLVFSVGATLSSLNLSSIIGFSQSSGNFNYIPAAANFNVLPVIGGINLGPQTGSINIGSTVAGFTNISSISTGTMDNLSIGTVTPVDGAFTKLTVTANSPPTNGLYLPAANTVGIAANGVEQLIVPTTASAVNLPSLTGGIAGAGAVLTVGGPSAETNASLNLSGRGTGSATVKGTGTNDAAAAGYVGEVLSSNVAIGSAVSITSATAKTVTSLALTAGDWDVWATLGYTANASTTATVFSGAISNTDNTLSTSPGAGAFFQLGLAVSAAGSMPVLPVGNIQFKVAAGGQTIYLVAQSTFAVSTMSAYGYIAARRRR